jgi:poly(3-hydroxybutyrate) depolymerase
MQTTKSKLSSRLKKIAWIVFIFTCTLLAVLYMFQEKLIFQPTSLKADYAFKFNQSFEEFTIPTTDGEQLNALVFSPADSSKGLIFYFHGNAGNLQRWGQYAIDFTKLGYTVLMIDYGYTRRKRILSGCKHCIDVGPATAHLYKTYFLRALVGCSRCFSARHTAHTQLAHSRNSLR